MSEFIVFRIPVVQGKTVKSINVVYEEDAKIENEIFLSTPISKIGIRMSTRLRNVLDQNRIWTAGDMLKACPEQTRLWRDFGHVSHRELCSIQEEIKKRIK